MNLWEWIGTWTFWNWLALVSFIILPLSALNAFLGLRARWRDWRTTKSVTKLKERLIQINNQAIATKLHRLDPPIFFIQLLDDAYYPAGAFIGTIFVILAIITILPNLTLIPDNSFYDNIFIKIFGVMGMLFLLVVMNFIVKVKTKILYFYHPEILANEAKKLLEKTEPLGLKIDFDIKHIKNLIEEVKLEKIDKIVKVDKLT